MSISTISGGLAAQITVEPGINTASTAPANASDSFAALLNGPSLSPGLTALPVPAAPPAEPLTPAQQAVKNFMDYMNESTAEKFEDAWLAAHHLTRQELAAMTPAQRALIMKEMAEDFKREIEQKVEEKLKGSAVATS